GFLPRLGKEGFTGPIYCTRGTADLHNVMLPDAAHLQEEEAEFANRHRTSKHDPALPLFAADDAARVLRRVRPVGFNGSFSPSAGVTPRVLNSGHIVGSGLIEVRIDGRVVVFSGDLGRYGVPIMRDPDPVPAADVLLVESTYGNRLHPGDDHPVKLASAVARAAAQRGWLLIPAFAVGRSQEILYDLRELEDAGRIPSLPIYLDSPMAIQATAIYAGHPEEHDEDLARVEASGAHPFGPKGLRISRTVEDSKRLNDTDGPGIIIAGSGMATGGRILHHFLRRLPEPQTTVFFRRVEVAGLERLPLSGPLVVAANHNQGLMDGILLVAALPRRLRPVAKAPLFRHPIIGPLTRLSGAIPVHRRQDERSGAIDNEAMFSAAESALAMGDAILIFPEGVSQPEPALMPLRTGTARLLLGAARDSGPAATLLPVGLMFREPGTFRAGSALVLVGEPVPTADLAALPTRGADGAVRRLTERLGEALQRLIVEAHDRRILDLVHAAESIWREEMPEAAR